ncbi:hypothetical protein EJ03DRAFT_332599 [Teratosphaeria nubilosa]|uniref:Uncharacterized protein n=1 Tax=Teratosphaeria nubilosa TaxID=161662 RepID=A0A6G1KTF6_9PEZI|nr:hypothetical protein EJ03DRAFT_332599 [Teratosphaeria nubilosa]
MEVCAAIRGKASRFRFQEVRGQAFCLLLVTFTMQGAFIFRPSSQIRTEVDSSIDAHISKSQVISEVVVEEAVESLPQADRDVSPRYQRAQMSPWCEYTVC